jgi:hypothetical protein
MTRNMPHVRRHRAWHAVGSVAIMLTVGGARFAAGVLFGGAAMSRLWNNQGIGLIGPVLVPLAITLCWCAWLKGRLLAQVEQTQTRSAASV